MNSSSILVIDDEPQIQKLLHITLQSNDYEVQEATSAKTGLITAANHPPDLILLDLGLPDENGQSVLKKLRHWYTKPIIIVTALRTEEEIIQALDNGANDYIIKPFRTGELLARIRAAIRDNIPGEQKNTITVKDLIIDLSNRTVKKNGETVKLSATEFSLLSLLATNSGKVLTHHYLLHGIWGPGFIQQSQYLRVYIAQLRKKIEEDPNRPFFIVTESGIGYRFADETIQPGSGI